MPQARRDAVPEYHGCGYKLSGFIVCFLMVDFVVWLALDFWQAASIHFQGASAGKAFADPLMFLTILFGAGLLGFYLYPRVQRSARFRHAVRRQAGAGVPLVEPQPSVRMVLPFPTIIRLRRRWPATVFWTTAIAILYCLYAVLIEFALAGSLGVAIFLAVALGLFAVAVIVAGLALNVSPEIEVTSEGFSHYVADSAQTILWTEADLFAIVDGGRNHPHAVIYELASPATTIRWKRLCRPSPFAIHQPAEPFDVYEQRMNALLGFIAARTGLPLYDLR